MDIGYVSHRSKRCLSQFSFPIWTWSTSYQTGTTWCSGFSLINNHEEFEALSKALSAAFLFGVIESCNKSINHSSSSQLWDSNSAAEIIRHPASTFAIYRAIKSLKLVSSKHPIIFTAIASPWVTSWTIDSFRVTVKAPLLSCDKKWK